MNSAGNCTSHIGNTVNIEGQNNTAITHNYGNNYYENSRRPNELVGLLKLAKAVTFSALHDSEARYPQPNVLPGTREEILGRLSYWCEAPSKISRVLWVHGAAGVGKSAIAQALSEKYIQAGQLAAAFFFSRNDATRDNLDSFVATIAYQLATSLDTHLAPLISHIVSSMPEVLHKKIESQFQILITEPSAQVDPRNWSHLPHLVIIDGVDECIQIESQKRLLQMIQAITPHLFLDFLIFSRPEPHIFHIFHHQSFVPAPSHLVLGHFAESVRKDIKKYLQHEFAHIQEDHWHILPHPPSLWPGDSVIMELLDRATGQFVYATTVMKYISHGKLPLTPMERLNIILQAKRTTNLSSPYPDLDLLYSQILQFCINDNGKLQQVLRLIVSPFNVHNSLETFAWLSSNQRETIDFGCLMVLEHLLELQQGEVSALLSGLHSIIDVPKAQTEKPTVLHASFSEFLLDPNHAGVYYVGPKLLEEEWRELFVAFQIRMLSQYCMKAEDLSICSDHHRIEGSYFIDFSLLKQVWKYVYEVQFSITIGDRIVAALDAFDPHLYAATLLSW
ncbi:hypothetical protein L218DRAFT_935295 [Marasmius fiardii PR-910]|nr:hypothetical protein L218DRAFT_935295 [Marasmius fiardii PR-910]